MGRLNDKVALISGGGRGQGAAEAEFFAQEGAKGVLGDLLDQEGLAVEERIKARGGDATYIHLDVTKDSDWQQAIDLTETRYGKLNVLVNNAGIARFTVSAGVVQVVPSPDPGPEPAASCRSIPVQHAWR